ncbi:DUF397 domain-containing protein, partial [Streptomyces mirabilis]
TSTATPGNEDHDLARERPGQGMYETSGTPQGSCVEMANLASRVGIRDSKNKRGPALLVTATAWTAFVGLVQSGQVGFDRGEID